MDPACENYAVGSCCFASLKRPTFVSAAQPGVFRARARKNPLQTVLIEEIEFYFLHNTFLAQKANQFNSELLPEQVCVMISRQK
jgi:hypothetical protein